jgi:ATP-grasp domain
MSTTLVPPSFYVVKPAGGLPARTRRSLTPLPRSSCSAPRRRRVALDRKALRKLILRFALLLHEAPEIVEADLNAVRCTTHGRVVLDTRLGIGPHQPVERNKTW